MNNYKGLKVYDQSEKQGPGWLFAYEVNTSRVSKVNDGWTWSSLYANGPTEVYNERDAINLAVSYIAPDLSEAFMIEYDKDVAVKKAEELVEILGQVLDGSIENVDIISDIDTNIESALTEARTLHIE